MGEGILSMAIATETQQLLMLERLRSAGTQPVTLDELRAGGIDFPAVVIGELELNGYAIERVYEHARQIVCACWRPTPMIHPPHAGATYGAAFRDSHPSQTSPARRWRSDVGDVASPGSLVVRSSASATSSRCSGRGGGSERVGQLQRCAAADRAAGGRSCSLKRIPAPSRRVSARSLKPSRSLLQRTLLL
jgi:hypothetical protein